MGKLTAKYRLEVPACTERRFLISSNNISIKFNPKIANFLRNLCKLKLYDLYKNIC